MIRPIQLVLDVTEGSMKSGLSIPQHPEGMVLRGAFQETPTLTVCAEALVMGKKAAVSALAAMKAIERNGIGVFNCLWVAG